MKRSKLSVVSIFVVVALIFTACTTAPSNTDSDSQSGETTLAEVQELRMITDNDPASLDPQLSVDGNGGQVLGYVLDPLVRLDPQGKPYPALADTWEVSDDSTVYTFHIRDDAKWSDGEALTAEDVYYTWFRAIDPAIASGNSYRFFDIVGAQSYFEGTTTDKAEVGIELLDNNSVKVTLTKPLPYFFELVTNVAYCPVRQSFIEEHGELFASDPEYVLANGPFVLKEWSRAQQVVLEKNPNYWNADNIKIEKVVFNIIPEPQVAIQMYEAGEIDMVNVDASLVSKYANDPELNRVASKNIAFTSFNTKDEFFSNLKLRQAFSMIMDRDAFANQVLNNGSKPIRGFVPYSYPGIGDKDFRAVSGDHINDISMDESKYSAEANALLEEGLAELGKTKEQLSEHLSILVFEEESKKQAQVMQESYKKYFEVDSNIEQLTLKVMIDRMFSGDYSVLIIGFGGFYIDPQAYLENYTSTSPMNTSGFADEKYDALVAEASKLVGEARTNKFVEAEAYLMEQAPIAPVYNRAGNLLIKPYLKGIDTESMYGTDVVNVYIEKH